MVQQKINFGCGGNILEGWRNFDLEIDITRPLPFENESTDYILAEHVYEHITPYQGILFLQECHRILKPKGVLRLCVPVMDYLVLRHNEQYLAINGGTIQKAVEMMSHEWGHQALYTEELLLILLKTNGFNCKVQEPYKSDHPALTNIDGHGKALDWTGIGDLMNWIETAIIDATKE